MDKKSLLRQELIKRRTALSNDDQQTKNKIICNRLLDELDWSNVSRLHIYKSRSDWCEVDTRGIISCLEQLYPDVAIDIASQHRDDSTQAKYEYDVILVPVLGYDADNNRLGMGMGWYDKFLATQPAAYKIGLAYSDSQIDQLPVEDHDQALDLIISA